MQKKVEHSHLQINIEDVESTYEDDMVIKTDRETVTEWFSRYRNTGDKKWRDLIFRSCMAWVKNLAAKKANSYGCGSYLDDLIQEGGIGLLRSIEKYDFAFGCSLTTYSFFWINALMDSFLLDHRHDIRRPKNFHWQYLRLKALVKDLDPELDSTPEEWDKLEKLMQESETVSMEEGAVKNASPKFKISDTLDFEDPNDHSGKVDSSQVLDVCKNYLRSNFTPTQAAVAIKRFGLAHPDDAPCSIKETGQDLKLTNRQVEKAERVVVNNREFRNLVYELTKTNELT